MVARDIFLLSFDILEQLYALLRADILQQRLQLCLDIVLLAYFTLFFLLYNGVLLVKVWIFLSIVISVPWRLIKDRWGSHSMLTWHPTWLLTAFPTLLPLLLEPCHVLILILTLGATLQGLVMHSINHHIPCLSIGFLQHAHLR